MPRVRVHRSAPHGRGHHAVPAGDRRGRLHLRGRRADVPQGRARGAAQARRRGHARHLSTTCARPTSPSCAASSTTPRPRANDKFVALDLLKNANIAAAGVLPMCQDTGTAIVMGKRGQNVLTEGGDEAGPLARHLRRVHRSSTCATRRWPRSPCGRRRTPAPTCPRRSSCTRPTAARTSSSSWPRAAARANKSFLYQETKAVLNEASMMKFLEEKIRSLGTAACPPYHLAIVVGGTSRRVRAEDREVRLRALPGRAARPRARRSGTASGTRSWRRRSSS